MPKLTGRVTAHGEPASTAVVELHNSQGDVVDQVQVDDAARYTYHLSEGTWTLNVWDAYGHRGKSVVQLGSEDQTTDVDLSEPEGGH